MTFDHKLAKIAGLIVRSWYCP